MSMFYKYPISQYKRPRFRVVENVRISTTIFRSEKVRNHSLQVKSSKWLKLLHMNHQPITLRRKR